MFLRYIHVAQWAIQQGKRPVFFLGPNETSWVEVIPKALPTALLPLQQAKEVTPWLTIALGHHLKAAVTNDCGTAHMLAAANTPLVSLFGPTRPEKFAPATTKLTVLKTQNWGSSRDMSVIPTDAVISALSVLL